MIHELAPADLAWRCPVSWIPWSSSLEIPPASTIVGQDRAVEAIAFSLEMRGLGFNVFVAGLSGTGRLTTIKQFLDRFAQDEEVPDDICFVFNFRNPETPSVLFLAAGAGRRFQQAMDVLVSELDEGVPSLLADKEFRHRVERAVADLQTRERELVEGFEAEVRGAGFALVQIQAGPVTRPEVLPMVGEGPVPLTELPRLVETGTIDEAEAERLRSDHERFTEKLHEVFGGVAELRVAAQERMEGVKQELLAPAVAKAVDQVRRKVKDDRLEPYLEVLSRDLEEHVDLFATADDGEQDRYLRWRVNLAVDNGAVQGRPVIIETEPSYTNLFGTVERSLSPAGEVTTSFLKIRAGSMLRANGGFLVLNADDLLLEPRVWPGLKRALKYRRVQIQSIESLVLGASALKPEPVPLDVKVFVIGDRGIYDLLFRHDSDFPKIFKVLADFDSVMQATEGNGRDVLSVLRKVSEEEGLLPMDRDGMAAMLEETVRMGRWRRRLSSRFSDVADLLREAASRARRQGSDHVGRGHVAAARAAAARRHALSEDRTHEYLSEGVIRVEVEGAAVGQLNGLAVYDLGHHRFGKPSRITAQVGLGRDGVINVERQAGLSGPTHDKGVQILTGFLRGTFARRVPLNMSCSITFEQSYGGVDGDSASSTEVYAILSALSEVPLRQDVAVTGSVDQYGRVQAIGGVNEKVEGYFRVCRDRGLTGEQGVMIPAANVADLHLGDEVVEAAEAGRFHLWAVDSVADGIRVLTGAEAGEWSEVAGWPEDSVYGRCQARLDEMARRMRQAGKDPDAQGNNGGSSNGQTPAGA